jgi:hypothetical protein
VWTVLTPDGSVMMQATVVGSAGRFAALVNVLEIRAISLMLS